MGKSNEYGVDLDALDEVVQKLNGVLKDMGDHNQKAKNNTYLPKSALGTGFHEADSLHSAHDQMKTYIQENVLGQIEQLIDDFGKKSKKTKEAYEDAEHDNSMS